MRWFRVIPRAGLFLGVFCGSAVFVGAEFQNPIGTVTGYVLSATDGRPLDGVFVEAGYVGTETDKSGAFTLDFYKAGRVVVDASRRDLLTTRTTAMVVPGKTTSVTLRLRPGPPPCCRLEGEWDADLVLGWPSTETVRKGARLTGTVLFSSVFPDTQLNRRTYAGDPTVDEFGRYQIDLTPFFGANVTSAHTNSLMPGRDQSYRDILTEVEGCIFNGTDVEIILIPRMSHGGLSFSGKIRGDVIRGDWVKRDVAATAGGTFTMKRRRPSGGN